VEVAENEAGEPELLRDIVSVAERPERDLRSACADTGCPDGEEAPAGGGEGDQAAPVRSASNYTAQNASKLFHCCCRHEGTFERYWLAAHE
jgi:hypothetical protein